MIFMFFYSSKVTIKSGVNIVMFGTYVWSLYTKVFEKYLQ